MKNNSKVAKIRQRLENEYIAAQRALNAPAMVAKHEFITARMESMQQAHIELQAIVGNEETIRIVVATLNNVQDVRIM